MNFEQLLSDYIGRQIEVFLSSNYYTGDLLSTGNGQFTILVTDPSYQTPTEQVTLFSNQVSFVRILAL
ncbi:hypothetical protein ACFOQM_17630 [Paenibacillus sp. GCM10012307]|uniref:Uncharacterized protein n=1 Tax=Paenibacillus roseus TaxID=2798579 RepID=A0A934J550_9BACL|nr:hypothetical protein [Paenibacillus roseus]MBJ6363045.1 hypothetical protein [Paenibacillus roseus]